MTDPLAQLAEWLVYGALGLAKGSTPAAALEFFVYDSVKIISLMFLMIFVMGIIRTYIPPERIRKLLSNKAPFLSNLGASLFGAITPFCSCSSIPIFISFIEAGVPLGVAFSFLVTSPLINEYLVVMMIGFFGLEITAIYILIGLVLGIGAGMMIGRMNMEKYLSEDLFKRRNSLKKKGHRFRSFTERLRFGIDEAKDITSKTWLWVLAGVGIGAAIHGFIPEEAISSAVSATGIFAVPVAVLIGVPIYANCTAVLPIAAALFDKGVPLGTALAFMMSTAALSLPEAVILRRAVKLPLLALFFGIVALGIVIVGYLLNFLFPIIM